MSKRLRSQATTKLLALVSENMEFCQKSSFLEREISPNRQVVFLGGAFKHVNFLHLFGEMKKT